MKGDPKVIELLNEALKNELTAVNQYWLHYRLLDNLGIDRLAEFERHESIDEMKHADRLAERILFLEGLPNFQMLGRLRIGETVEEMLKADLAVEIEAVQQLKGAIAHCEKQNGLIFINAIVRRKRFRIRKFTQSFHDLPRGTCADPINYFTAKISCALP